MYNNQVLQGKLNPHARAETSMEGSVVNDDGVNTPKGPTDLRLTHT